MNKNQPIGVIDSGVGGLTVLKWLKAKMPHEDFIFIGDTARTPYGNRSREEITRFVGDMTAYLNECRIKQLVVACNTITVLGTGDIGTEFARRAKAMGAKDIRGVRRTKKAADPAFDGVFTHEELDSLLPDTDILVMALPSTADTVGILSRERIALLPRDAIVVNVGRGTAIDQEALMEALNAGRIAGAALDVVVPEPLPREHPLWSTRNLLLTPICPHSTRSSSYVLSPEHVITVEAADANRKFVYLSVDGGKAFSLKNGDKVRVRQSKFTTKLVRLSKKSFCEILDSKMGMEAAKHEE